jgi:ribonuclease D
MNTQYQLVKTADELRRAVEQLSSRPAIGVDTETTDLDPYLARLRLIQLATSDGVFIVRCKSVRQRRS